MLHAGVGSTFAITRADIRVLQRMAVRFASNPPVTLMHNTSAYHALPSLISAVHETLSGLSQSGQAASLAVHSHPLPLTAEESVQLDGILLVLASLFVLVPFCLMSGSRHLSAHELCIKRIFGPSWTQTIQKCHLASSTFSESKSSAFIEGLRSCSCRAFLVLTRPSAPVHRCCPGPYQLCLCQFHLSLPEHGGAIRGVLLKPACWSCLRPVMACTQGPSASAPLLSVV